MWRLKLSHRSMFHCSILWNAPVIQVVRWFANFRKIIENWNIYHQLWSWLQSILTCRWGARTVKKGGTERGVKWAVKRAITTPATRSQVLVTKLLSCSYSPHLSFTVHRFHEYSSWIREFLFYRSRFSFGLMVAKLYHTRITVNLSINYQFVMIFFISA